MRHGRIYALFSIGVVSVGTACASQFVVASSDFSVDLDGWSSSPGEQWLPTHSSTGGNPGGYARGADGPGEPSYFFAPAKFLGDWTSLLSASPGGAPGGLAWDAITLSLGSEPVPFASYPLLRISGPGGSAIIDSKLNVFPSLGQWRHQYMPISEGVFTMQSGTWLGLLANVTAVEINVEIASNGTGPELETWGLDNVQLYSAAVPEMPTALLTIAGLVLLRSRNSVSFIVGKLKR